MRGCSRALAAATAVALVSTLLAACGSEPAAEPRGARRVTIAGPGGSRLSAVELGSGRTAVVLAHGASTDRTSWYGAMPGLAAAGYRVVAFDARGVGASTGSRRDDPTARAADIDAVAGAVRRAGATSVVVMGSSLGALATLESAATGDYAAIVGVSPPEVPDGLDRVREPALFVASEGDTGPAQATRALARRFGRPAVVVDGSIHGAGLFATHPAAVRALVAFLAGTAAASR
jgi:pimeloyl-ACP methyl ester carboxylesterase